MRLSVPIAILFSTAVFADAAEPAAARWEGAVELPGREIRLVVDLAQASGGQWAGSVIVPGFGIKGAALSGIEVKDSSVSFALKGSLGDPTFAGHLNSNGTLTGEYKQAGNTAPFTLKNVGAAQVEPLPVSTAVRKELEAEWQGEMIYSGRTIHVRIKLANQPDGKATGQFFIKGTKETTLPIDLVTQEGDMLTVEVYERGMTYEGQFRKARNEITGEFKQQGIELPLILHPAVKQ